MIRLNLMTAAQEANDPKATKAAAKAVKAERPAKVERASKPQSEAPVVSSSRPSSRRNPAVTLVFAILFVAASVIAYLLVMGVPAPLQGVIPENALALLGLGDDSHEVPALPGTQDAPPPPPAASAVPPQVVAQGPAPVRPVVPVNGAVEEIVKTLRPELFDKAKAPVANPYQALPPSDKMLFQKQAFFHVLGTLYAITPESVGFLDIAYKAPDYYFVRAAAADPRSQKEFLDRLKGASRAFKQIPASSTTDEITVYGTLMIPAAQGHEQVPLTPEAEVAKELLALRDIATRFGVRFAGLEKPIATPFGAYKRQLFRTTTQADYPSLLRFAEALKNSHSRIGVLQFTSRPTQHGGMSSGVDFVIYTAP